MTWGSLGKLYPVPVKSSHKSYPSNVKEAETEMHSGSVTLILTGIRTSEYKQDICSYVFVFLQVWEVSQLLAGCSLTSKSPESPPIPFASAHAVPASIEAANLPCQGAQEEIRHSCFPDKTSKQNKPGRKYLKIELKASYRNAFYILIIVFFFQSQSTFKGGCQI